MKKAIKQKPKASSTNKKSAKRYTANKAGYKEEVYSHEQQSSYEKSDIAKDNRKNTSGPKS